MNTLTNISPRIRAISVQNKETGEESYERKLEKEFKE
jgi:hypothetical protein